MLNRTIKHNPGVTFVVLVIWPSLILLYILISLAKGT